MDISADSTVAITGSEDMTAKISNVHTGKVLGTFVGRPLQMANSIAFESQLWCVHSNAHNSAAFTEPSD